MRVTFGIGSSLEEDAMAAVLSVMETDPRDILRIDRDCSRCMSSNPKPEEITVIVFLDSTQSDLCWILRVVSWQEADYAILQEALAQSWQRSASRCKLIGRVRLERRASSLIVVVEVVMIGRLGVENSMPTCPCDG